MTPFRPDEITVSRGVVSHLGARPGRCVVRASDVGGASSQGTRRRRNEDAWGFREAQVFVVADGMGGRPDGDLAAGAAVDRALAELCAERIAWDDAVERMNESVVDACTADEPPGGAVFVALRCVADRVSVVHAGDSRAFRIRGRCAEPLTSDHSVAAAVHHAGMRRSESGLGARQLDAVTAYLGYGDAWRDFTVRDLTVRRGDRIVLTSDGVHDHLDAAVWSMLAGIDSAGEAAEFLVATAQAAGSTDDATAVVVDLDVAAQERTDDPGDGSDR